MDEYSNPGMTPIRIGDVLQILSKRINDNERPYTKTVVEINNKTIQEFYKDILLNISTKNGTVKAGQVWGEWTYYYTGKYITQFINHLENGAINRVDQIVLDYWIEFFDKATPESLIDLGPATVGHGWKLVTDEITIRRNISRWEKIYKGTDDPMKWREKCHDNPKEWSTDEDYIFWMNEKYLNIEQKVKSVLHVPSAPINSQTIDIKDIETVLICPIDKNELPYKQKVILEYNKNINDWVKNVLPDIVKEQNDVKTIDRNEIVAELGFFHDGNIIHKFMSSYNKGLILRPSGKSVKYWKNLFENGSINELMEIGHMTVKQGWKIITDEIYIRSVLYKWNCIYNVSTNPIDWRNQVKNLDKNKQTYKLWDDDTHRSSIQKVLTVIKNIVSVE